MSNFYDAGILTFWGVPNYGTFAQAYALQKVLECRMPGRDVRQINHLDRYHYHFYYKRYACYKIWNRMYWKERRRSITERAERNAKKRVFSLAYDKIPHTAPLSKASAAKAGFQKVFLGSDIIWDFSVSVFHNDPMLFGGCLNTEELYSYAASFGTVKRNTPVPDYVKTSLQKMKAVSVRDENSAHIAEALTGKKAEVVLDPVWLWDFEQDCNIRVPEHKDYILVYGQDFTDEYIQNLIRYAKKERLKIIALDCNADRYEWCDLLIKQCDLDPFLWIGYFKNASVVATSTFHGLTFGLVFRKKIAFCKTDFILSKIGTFLKQIRLYELFEDENNVEKMLSYHWDYAKVDEWITEQKERSFKFLEKAIE